MKAGGGASTESYRDANVRPVTVWLLSPGDLVEGVRLSK
jgi:hypothetical protein